jgi:hypothetical protein
MDRVRLAHHVRGRWPPVQIIVTSGMADTLLSQLPMDSIFVSKPIERQNLWVALASMAGESRPSPPASPA